MWKNSSARRITPRPCARATHTRVWRGTQYWIVETAEKFRINPTSRDYYESSRFSHNTTIWYTGAVVAQAVPCAPASRSASPSHKYYNIITNCARTETLEERYADEEFKFSRFRPKIKRTKWYFSSGEQPLLLLNGDRIGISDRCCRNNRHRIM